MLVKSFAHLNQNFFAASLEERGKLWKSLTVYYYRPRSLAKQGDYALGSVRLSVRLCVCDLMAEPFDLRPCYLYYCLHFTLPSSEKIALFMNGLIAYDIRTHSFYTSRETEVVQPSFGKVLAFSVQPPFPCSCRPTVPDRNNVCPPL